LTIRRRSMIDQWPPAGESKTARGASLKGTQ
jgi:hypothetical protein